MSGYRPEPIRRVREKNADYDFPQYQIGWIFQYNYNKDCMIAVPDICFALNSQDSGVWNSLRKDMALNVLSSTKIKDIKKNLSAVVEHNSGSKVIEPTQIALRILPLYDNTTLDEALGDDAGIYYLQALLDKNCGPERITAYLKAFSGKESNDILLSTIDAYQPGKECAIGLFYKDNKFHISCLPAETSIGFSRGVEIIR
ncbi:hypothetical protein KY366_08015 [Candidatus Woesearchaeota archaeon]|nr:hypothetical protein [Candidatus Woesearchaeota archaeon]